MVGKPLYRLLWISLLCLLFALQMTGFNIYQDLPDSTAWLELRDNYIYEPFKADTEIIKEPNIIEDRSGELSFYDLLRFVLALLLLALMLTGAIFLFRRYRRNQKLKMDSSQPETYFKNIEANIDQIDLDKEIQKAVKSERFDIAVRLWYLKCLKLLSLAKWIRYQAHRPNGEYVSQMSIHPWARESFSKLTVVFDAIRYGNRMVNAQEYSKLNNQFIAFCNRIPPTQIRQ